MKKNNSSVHRYKSMKLLRLIDQSYYYLDATFKDKDEKINNDTFMYLFIFWYTSFNIK